MKKSYDIDNFHILINDIIHNEINLQKIAYHHIIDSISSYENIQNMLNTNTDPYDKFIHIICILNVIKSKKLNDDYTKYEIIEQIINDYLINNDFIGGLIVTSKYIHIKNELDNYLNHVDLRKQIHSNNYQKNIVPDTINESPKKSLEELNEKDLIDNSPKIKNEWNDVLNTKVNTTYLPIALCSIGAIALLKLKK